MTVFRFDDVEVDAEAFQARKAGVPVALEPKALEVLLLLIRSEGRLVTKSALQEAVWPGTFVTESALTRLVAQLRKSLGDDAREARYIETVPTRGYRFVGRVNGSAPATPPPREGTGMEGDAPRARGPRLTGGGKAALLLAALGAIVLGAVALRSVRRGADVGTPPYRTGSRLLVSTTTGFNAHPVFSPDGSSLAFSSDRTGALEIWIRSLAPGARELQVTSDAQNNIQPAWSPDGTRIAFSSMGRGGIWVVPALGGLPRQVTTFGSAPAWAPDGRSLAFVSSEIVQVDFPGSSTSTIWLVPAEGGTPRRLTERWKPAGGHRSVSFAPDGRRLAFTSGGQVYMLELGEGTSNPRNVVSAEAGPGIHGIGSLGGWGEVRWSPDGQSLVGIGRQGHEVVLWRHDLLRGVRTEPVTLLVGEPTQLLGHMALAPDGRRIAYSVLSARTDIMNLLLGADGRAASSPSPLFPGLVSRKALPQLSLDGRRIAFLLWRPGEGPVLYTAGSDGKDPTPAGATGALGGASFGPTGRLIGAVKEADEDGHRLLEIDPASGAQRTLRRLPPAAWVRLSPDGQQVAFMCGGAPVFAICTAAVSGGDPKTLLAPKEGAGWPVWSPDGRQLAVELFDGEDTFVAVMPSEGGAPRRLTEARGQSWPHSWTPDGRSVVFAGQRHGLWNVYAVDVETGRERALTGYDRAVVYVRYPAWSPAGDRVVFEHTELSGNVWVAPLPGP